MRFFQVGGMVWIFIGAILIIGSIKLRWGTLYNPDSGLMPLLTGGLLVILGIGLMVENIRKWSIKKEREGGRIPIREFWRRGFWSIVMCIGYLFGMEVLGFSLASFLFIFSLLKLFETPKWLAPLLFSLLCAIASYILFGIVLKVNFPRGVFNIG